MTKKQKFFYNGTLLTMVALAVKTVNLAFGAFIGKAIGAEALGLYTLVGTVYAFGVTFATSGINLTVTRRVAAAVGEGKEYEIPRIMRHAVVYAMIFSSVAALVLFFGAGYFANGVLKEMRSVRPFRILSASLIPISLSAVISGYFVGVKRITRSALTQVAAQVFKIFITVFFVLKMAPGGVESATVALCISSVLSELFSLAFAFIQYLFEPRVNSQNASSRFSEITEMAVPLALSAYIRSALLTVEHVLIPQRLRQRGESESEALTSYGLLHGMALPIILYPMSPLSSFSGLLVPEFAEDEARYDRSRQKRIAEKVIGATLAYSVPCAVFIYLFSEELGRLIYSSFEAGRYIAFLAPVLPIMYLDHVTDAMLKGIGEHVYSMWVNISDSFLSVVLVWFLIPKLGITGYALIIIIMEGYNFIFSARRLKKRVGFDGRIFLSAALPVFAAFLSAQLAETLFRFGGVQNSLLWPVSKLLFAVSLYLALYLGARAFVGRKVDNLEMKCYNKD